MHSIAATIEALILALMPKIGLFPATSKQPDVRWTYACRHGLRTYLP